MARQLIGGAPLTPQEFAASYLNGDIRSINTIQDIWDYLDTHPEEERSDYPLDEVLDFVDSTGCPLVLVQDDTGEMRWFETEPEDLW